MIGHDDITQLAVLMREHGIRAVTLNDRGATVLAMELFENYERPVPAKDMTPEEQAVARDAQKKENARARQEQQQLLFAASEGFREEPEDR